MHIRSLVLLPAIALAACGGSTPPAAPAEAAQLRALAKTIVGSIEDYGSQARSMASSTGCRTERSQYEARVGPAIEGIIALAPALDPWMGTRGPSAHADLGCGAAAMLAEFQRHTDIACTSLDLATNRAETAAHVVTMRRWADLVAARGEEAGEPRGGGASGGGPRCVRFSDGALMYLP
jgi:hypothetical protein